MLPKLTTTYVKELSLCCVASLATERQGWLIYRFMWVLCQEGVQLLVSACPGDVAGNFRDWRSYRLWLQQREVSMQATPKLGRLAHESRLRP